MSAPYAVLAAGGTGGHMFPAQALSEELLRRGWRVALASDARGLRYGDGFPQAVMRHQLESATTARGGLLGKLKAPFALASGVIQAMRWFRKDRPDVVVGFGGYPAAPAMAAAKGLRLPRVIHEQNGVLGRANRLFARGADVLACGFEAPANAPSGAAVHVTGNPIRDDAARLAGAPYAAPGEGADIRLLVFGGSQGASIFAEEVPPALSLLPDALRARIRVTAQVRESDHEGAEIRYDAAEIPAELAAFFSDMPRRIEDAHLVMARAGASTCAEIAAIGRPALLVPLPSAMNDHQTANASALERAGAAVLAPQATLTTESLAATLEALLSDPARLTAMAEAARNAGRPDAASALADLVEQAARLKK